MDSVECVAARIVCDGERHWLKQLDCWQWYSHSNADS
jgi:hypothetical protein